MSVQKYTNRSSVWTTASLERILWIASFLTVIYKFYHESFSLLSYNILLGWLVLVLLGVKALHLRSLHTRNSSSRQSVNKILASQPEAPLDTKTTDATTQLSDHQLRRDRALRKSSQIGQSASHAFGIFGADQTSFRADADDGILCGILLLPMIAVSKVLDASHQDLLPLEMEHLQVKLGLTLLFGVTFLVLLLANGQLRLAGSIIRKRNMILSSLLLSSVIIYTSTFFFSLTPLLGSTPIGLTIVSVSVFQWALYTCVIALKRCFTLGEMCILSEATGLLVHGAMEIVFATYIPSWAPAYLKMQIDPCDVLIHALVIGIALVGLLCYPLLQRSRRLAQTSYAQSSLTQQVRSNMKHNESMVAFSFYFATALFVLAVIMPICSTVIGTNPFLWTFLFVYSSPSRVLLCIFWAVTIAITVVIWLRVLDFNPTDVQLTSSEIKDRSIKPLTSALNKKRKIFHALAVVLFTPGVFFEPSFLRLAFGVALAMFMYLEYLRYFAVWPFGKSIHVFLTEFIDSRDLGPVILSHIYLLLGCAGPVWLESSNVLASMSGIITLGFGDTAASLVGKRFGRWHWPGSPKTVEGTIAFVVTVFTSTVLIIYTSAYFGVHRASYAALSMTGSDWGTFFIISTASGLLEAFSAQNDNIVIPLYMYLFTILYRLPS